MPATRFAASRRSSSTRSTRSYRPSGAPTWPCPSNGSRRAAIGRPSASASPRRSGRSKKLHAFSAAWSRPPPASAARAARRRPRRAAAAAGPYDEEKTAIDIGNEFAVHTRAVRYRPVTIVDAGAKKALNLKIEVPVEDMARLGQTVQRVHGRQPRRPAVNSGSIWSAIHPRLLELIRAHRSTLIFVNSRRLAERMAGALNELAGETLVRSHHGSIARAQRTEVEDLLKAGGCARSWPPRRSSLASTWAPSISSCRSRRRRRSRAACSESAAAAISVDAVSEGVIFPKFRGDLVASAAVAKAMHDGAVESSRYPRNPLDIVAQQIVAMTAMDEWNVDELFATLRRAAPFAELSRSAFEGVLDMLSGRYPSDEFAELRPRVTWDRVGGTIVAREGAKRVAVANGGTIPDRGLYGVYRAGAGPGSARVGELDEEMVFESRPGETFVLGASSWRIEEITHDRVLVSPAPGEPGKMPFWKGDRAGRPLELGLAIGRLVHDLLRLAPAAAIERLTREHDLDTRAAENLLQYLTDQRAAARAVPDAGHDRHRARSRRARRLARVRAVAARRTHPRAVGDGGGRQDSRGDRHRRRNALGRRWVRREVSGRGPAARRAAPAAGS